MERPSSIKKADLKSLAKALHKVRFEDRPNFSYSGPIFETLVTLKKFLEDVFRKAAKDPVLKKRTGAAFRPKLNVSWWYQEEKQGKEWLWIGCQAQLKKPHDGIKSFGAALILFDKSEKYDLVAYLVDTERTWLANEKNYPKKDVDCAEFEQMAIRYWANKLK